MYIPLEPNDYFYDINRTCFRYYHYHKLTDVSPFTDHALYSTTRSGDHPRVDATGCGASDRRGAVAGQEHAQVSHDDAARYSAVQCSAVRVHCALTADLSYDMQLLIMNMYSSCTYDISCLTMIVTMTVTMMVSDNVSI